MLINRINTFLVLFKKLTKTKLDFLISLHLNNQSDKEESLFFVSNRIIFWCLNNQHIEKIKIHRIIKIRITVLYIGAMLNNLLKPVCMSEIVIFTFYIEQKL